MLKSISISASILFLLLNSAIAQTEYFTGWDNATQSAGWTQIKKGDMGIYEWVKDGSSSVSPDSCLAHYYPVGGSVPTDDWYVSPAFDFGAGGWIDTLWYNYSGFGVPMAGDSLVLYLLNGSPDPDLASKTVLFSFSDSTYIADAVWREELMIPVGTFAGDSYLAFRYYTTNNWLDVRFDNLNVTSFGTNSIAEIEKEYDFTIYPNPSSTTINMNLVNIDANQISRVMIYTVSGKLVFNSDTALESIDISTFETGFYILQLETSNGLVSKQFEVKK